MHQDCFLSRANFYALENFLRYTHFVYTWPGHQEAESTAENTDYRPPHEAGLLVLMVFVPLIAYAIFNVIRGETERAVIGTFWNTETLSIPKHFRNGDDSIDSMVNKIRSMECFNGANEKDLVIASNRELMSWEFDGDSLEAVQIST